MRYAEIPEVGRKAASICMGLTILDGSLDERLAWRIMDMYIDMGGNFFDTAHVYGQTADGHSMSECSLGRWLKARGGRSGVIVATKGAHYDLKDRSSRLSRADIMSDCERSLADIGTDYIDLYWLHRDDESRPVSDIIDTLNALKRRGMVGALGASNWSAARIAAANEYAAQTGQSGFSADQPQWSLAYQVKRDDPTLVQMNAELFDMHMRSGMPAVPFSSQAKGFYSKLDAGGIEALPPKARSRFAVPENLRKLPAIRKIAAAHGVSVGAVALGYLTSQPFPVFPIVGITREKYMDDVRMAGDLVLSEAEVRELKTA